MFVDPWFWDIVFDQVVEIDNEYYSMILKNGTSSIENYVGHRGISLKQIWMEKFGDSPNSEPDEPFTINVIWRDPVSRYFSALRTVQVINEKYNITANRTMDQVPRKGPTTDSYGWYMDPHMHPQYWYLVNTFIYCNCSEKLRFKFMSINDLDKIIGKERKNASSEKPNTSASQRTIIKERYTIDLITNNYMIGETFNFPEWMEFLCDNLTKYYNNNKRINYPRYKNFYHLTNPKYSVSNFNKKMEKYNESLEKIAELAKNSKI